MTFETVQTCFAQAKLMTTSNSKHSSENTIIKRTLIGTLTIIGGYCVYLFVKRNGLNVEKQKLEKIVHTLEQNKHETEIEISQLKQTILDLSTDNKNKANQLQLQNTDRNNNDTHQQTINNLKMQIMKADFNANGLKSQIALLQKEKTELVKDGQHSHDSATKQKSELLQNLETLQNEKNALQENIRALEKTIMDWDIKCSKKDIKLKLTLENNANLQKRLAQSSRKEVEFNNQLKELQTKLEINRNDSKIAISELTQSEKALNKERSELKESIRTLEREKQEMQQQIDALEQQKEISIDTASKLRTLKKTHSQIIATHSQSAIKSNQQMDRIRKMQVREKQLMQELEESQRTRNDIKQQLESLEQKSAQVLQGLGETFHKKEIKYKAKMTELARTAKSAQSAKQKLENEKLQLELEVKTLSKSKQRLVAKLENSAKLMIDNVSGNDANTN